VSGGAPSAPARLAGDGPEPGAWQCLREDVGRYFRYARAQGTWERIRIITQTEGIWAIAAYRAGRYLREEAPAPVRSALRLPFALVREGLRLAVGIYLDPSARIGPGLYIGHSGGIWVAPGSVIGRECNLSQGVVLGVGGTLRRGTPRLGDRVWVGPKATVTGPVQVGDGAVIGANSLVVSNVPERGVAVGVPARVVALSGSKALIG
jgi:serine O-acetyltransferase